MTEAPAPEPSSGDPEAEELRMAQRRRELRERRQAELAPEPEAQQHERRAERADYLAEKLEERADAGRDPQP